MAVRRASATAMKARATKESGPVVRERHAQPWPQRLDQVIHDRTRLAILAALAASEALSFTVGSTVAGDMRTPLTAIPGFASSRTAPTSAADAR